MKHFIKILLIIFFVNNAFSQSGWIQQNSGITDTINSVKFVNSNTGWCVGNNAKILITSNGGNTWFQQTSPVVTNLYSISFTSAQTGYIGGISGVVLKTTNGGINWITLNLQNNHNIVSTSFPNENVGYLGGLNESPNIYKTLDGGSSFESIDSDDIDLLWSINFINPLTGWICGLVNVVSSPKVSKTTNGGINWTYRGFMGGSSTRLFSVFFVDSLFGWIANPHAPPFFDSPTVFRSTNGGENWIAPLQNTLGHMHSIFAVNRNKAWAVGISRHIFITTNGGINWLEQNHQISMLNFNSVYFTDSLTGWVVGDSGTILKTTTGGVLTNFANTSLEIPDKYYLSQNYPNPFNPVTNLEFGISSAAGGLGFVSLKVYDVLGNEVATLVNENKPPGIYNYQLSTINYQLASGIYFYSLSVDGSLVDTKKMILLK